VNWPEWRCPLHHRKLETRSDCLACPDGHVYPVVNGIPRFVRGPTYADHFGTQWNQYRMTQLDSRTGVPITRDRTRRCLGEALFDSLSGKHVLECGCGAGRFTEVLLSREASVTSIDLSSAVEANEATFPTSERHRVAQADIYSLPFAPRSFDIVFCLGVIQHTPSPDNTIAQLYENVAPGGWLIIDHYRFNWGWYTRTAPWFRAILKRLPPGLSLDITEKLVTTLLPLHRSAARHRLAWSIINRLSPVLCYYRSLPQLSEQQQKEWALLDTHDSLTDWYKHFRTPEQIRRHLEALGLVSIWCSSDPYTIVARGCRPG
jgi:SAM-dependent methyltransferase